ncbi:MAG: FHA domain-containing protein [Candidatus Aminicenantes bacterium]|nr:FHA domain-containing protein [Candidatus Aminicenantes bacterium]
MSFRAELVVQKGDDQGKQFTLHSRATTIGRTGARKNDIELIDDTVSKEQATILCDVANRQFFINNESTTNATKVNNQIITEMTVLQFGDMIEIGNTVLLFKKTDF